LRKVNKNLYFFLRNATETYARLNHRLEVIGAENVPLSGGALLCPNHSNYSDPFFLGAAVRGRVLHFLAWHGIAEMPLVGPIFKKVGAMHPINESYGVATNKEEAREVLGGLEELLRNGELVVIFPEGRIKHWISPTGDDLHDFKPGAARLAARAAVPIIPVAMIGTRWVLMNLINWHDFGGPDKSIFIPIALPVKVRVRFGAPFHVNPAAAGDKEVCLRESERLRDTIDSMLKNT